MTKKYLLIIKNEYYTTHAFYTLEEAKMSAQNEKYFQTIIIDLETEMIMDLENIEWIGNK
ncbi:hypothetical protein C6B38_01310 [Spiroplasma sp. ChiS]|uniref:hypothetical protein n=1 Tax=Spiroplasma sp. ChiS TaxID=2099885 RepID=UPI000CF85D30|nr:hypothetical protein [Spiroplasma sp. ChiS]PQP79408.1 hypothetical protein C6B38_01310 [Spiroplasma sp. ChiS]